jgi:hypothetical protein
MRKLMSREGNDFSAPDFTSVWQMVQIGLSELENCCA